MRSGIGKLSMLVAVAVLVSLSGAALAAKPGAKAARGDQRGPLVRVQAILEKLDLTDEQARKIGDLISDAQQQLQALREEAKASADKTAVREKARAVVTDTLKKVAGELTPEQKAKFREQMKQVREQRKAEQPPSTRPAK